MQISRFGAAALFAAAVLLAAPCVAAESDSSSDAATTAVSQGIFTSWFSGRSPKVPDETLAQTQPAVATPAASLIASALGLLGIGYRMGGSSPSSGFDCSGMVGYVFRNAVGLSLPRRAEEISRVGTKVTRDQLQPGDLVFYKTLRRAFSHVGIYLGNNRFIHAPSAGGAVRVDDMTEHYWAARFTGARRVES